MTQFKLPKDHRPYTDKYFLRANEILQREGLNPFVTAQVFLRGEGKIYGLKEATAILDKYSNFLTNGGKLFTIKERSKYHNEEPVMLIQARIQDIIELETMYLGVISAQTTIKNHGLDIDLKKIKTNMEAIVSQIGKRPVMYFGARHWRYDADEQISKAAFDGGASDCSTDIGASTTGKEGIGTIPHSLECVYGWKYGQENAVYESTSAFDRVIDQKVPRIALIDYYNREIADTIRLGKPLKNRLHGIRIDTCGENVMQGCTYAGYNIKDYWGQKGVSISGVQGLISVIRAGRHYEPKIYLTSGFANIEKVNAFVEAERQSGMKLFHGLGVGEIFPGRFATCDIVEVGEDLDNMKRISKVGREYRANMHRLKPI